MNDPTLDLRPAEILWMAWREWLVIEEDAELLTPEYCEVN
jgi:hypothetical protein